MLKDLASTKSPRKTILHTIGTLISWTIAWRAYSRTTGQSPSSLDNLVAVRLPQAQPAGLTRQYCIKHPGTLSTSCFSNIIALDNPSAVPDCRHSLKRTAFELLKYNRLKGRGRNQKQSCCHVVCGWLRDY